MKSKYLLSLSTALITSLLSSTAHASFFTQKVEEHVEAQYVAGNMTAEAAAAIRASVGLEADAEEAARVQAEAARVAAARVEEARRAQVAADAEMARGFVGGDAEAVRRAQVAADAELAWGLYTAGAGAAAADDVRPDMPGDVILSYAAYDLAVRTNVRRDMNVHAFNAATGLKARLPVLLEADTFSDPNTKFAATRTAIEASPFYATFNRQAPLGTNMDALRAHLAGNPVEAGETNTNIEEIFSRVWSLAQNSPDLARQVFVALCDNTETGGGCYPGHAGRLARLYVNFLRSEWKED